MEENFTTPPSGTIDSDQQEKDMDKMELQHLMDSGRTLLMLKMESVGTVGKKDHGFEAPEVTDNEKQLKDQQDEKTMPDREETEICDTGNPVNMEDPKNESLMRTPSGTVNPDQKQQDIDRMEPQPFMDPSPTIMQEQMEDVGTDGRQHHGCEAPEVTDKENEFNDHKNEKSKIDKKTECKPKHPCSPQTVTPDLTIVLIGEADSVDLGCGNLLITHDRQQTPAAAAESSQIAPRLYDLCGRHVFVINMLGLQRAEQSEQVSLESYIGQVAQDLGIQAFLLFTSLGPKNDSFTREAQWLQTKLGEKALTFVMTVFTGENEQDCSSEFSELTDHSQLKHLIDTSRDRHHTCKRSLNDPSEILVMLDKIDIMISENDPGCYNGDMYDEVSRQRQDHQQEKDLYTLPKKVKVEPGDMSEEVTEIIDQVEETRLQQTEKTSEDKSDPKKTHLADVEQLMCRLQLRDKYDNKLTTADFLNIDSFLKHHHEPKSEKELAQTFMQRLLMLDYRARYIDVREEDSEMDPITHTPNIVNVDIDENVVDALFSKREVSDPEKKHTHVHPMDIQMAVFHCSDSFLRQYMFTKLSSCQYALPLLVPNPFTQDIECPLWAFRQIKKSWKSTSSSNKIESKSMPIYKAETPMITFFRLGSVSSSKSQLMNNLINQRHNTFFHRDCPGSTKNCILMEGVAEIAWYYPAGKANDVFTDCVAFCNLHGDALANEQERDILTELSSVNVVLLSSLIKNDRGLTIVQELVKSAKPLICLLTDDDSAATELKAGKYKIGLRDRSQSDVFKELRGIIREMLSRPFQPFFLEKVVEHAAIRLDEKDEVCQTGKNAAMQIMQLFEDVKLSEIKDTFLPCQGGLWHDWCQRNKNLYRLQGNLEMEKNKIQQELRQIRLQQQIVSFSEFMELFLTSLRSLGSKERMYFLKWIGFFLEDLCTEELSELHHKYNEKWSEVLALKKKHDKSVKFQNKQKELEEISNNLQSASVGFEHICREMGQIYEAHKSVHSNIRGADKINLSYLPELAAELMISGHPMELMDGDAGHVPLVWIKSVLDEVIMKLGDPRVFVLSILGIQSTGKSTMLNAMFGLQFAVSAGRCTRGAFMQLVRVSEEMKKDLTFDYVLVLDTEGLRALELAGRATHHHDNELATFVIGLGNMTLINIFGENPAEMQDIIQIAVQAFMRMKKVKLSPSCVFVHQNVGDITAGEKNMEGKRRLQEKLDEMTQLAAKEEVCYVECFSEVIAFDIQRDVKYFSQLWEGSPPMAPPNPSYSENVQELKNTILTKSSVSMNMTLSTFKARVEDLWNALLNENFVFSFKNTLEISVYRKLEVQYGKWTWALRSAILTIENQLYNRIENGQPHTNVKTYLIAEMKKTLDEVQEAMKKYFDEDRDKDTLVQWRGRFESKIGELHDELVMESQKKLREVIQQREACQKLDEKKKQYEDMLFKKSKELALKLKDKTMNEEQLQEEFDCVWGEWVAELTENTPAIEDINISEKILHILVEMGHEFALVLDRRTCKMYTKICMLGNYYEYVTLTKHQDLTQQSKDSEMTKPNEGTKLHKKSIFNVLKQFFGMSSSGEKPMENSHLSNALTYEANNIITTFINAVVKETENIIKKAPTATRGYNDGYLQDIAVCVQSRVKDFETENKYYVLKKEFTVDLLLHVSELAGKVLSRTHREFKSNNDALTYLNSKKTQYHSIFKSFCKGASSVTVLSQLICHELKPSIFQAIYDKTAIDLAGEMQSSCPPFSGNRSNLEKHILISLAEEENFNCYINYIKSPRTHFKTFIKEAVKRYIFKENSTKTLCIIKDNLKVKAQRVSKAVHNATETVKTQKGDTRMWLQEFSNLLRDELKFNDNRHADFSDITNFEFLEEVLKDGLEAEVNEISQSLSQGSLLKMENFRERPDDILIKQFCDCCWVQCPFCHAICTNTMNRHQGVDHSVAFHRPYGLNGWHFRDTVQLCTSFCTSSVASDQHFFPNHDSDKSIPWKEYKTGGPKYADWSITPDLSELPYWKWFVCRFQEDLEKYYGKRFLGMGAIPCEWKTYTKTQAIESL